MPAPFPHRYHVEVDGLQLPGQVRAAPRPVIVGGPPPQFDGQEEWWSPEELLIGAVGLCLMNTFRSLQKREPLDVQKYESRVEGILDKTTAGLVFTAIVVRVEIVVPADQVDRAKRTLETAKRYCIVSNALKAPVTLEAIVRAPA